MIKRVILTIALSVSLAGETVAFGGEPLVQLPESAIIFPAGDVVTLNGIPMRMRAFSSREPIRKLASWFLKSLGAPLKIDTRGNSVILGKLDHGYYVTVQLEPSGKQVQGVVAVTDLKAMSQQRLAYRQQLNLWLSAWPYGSRVISDMTSHDQGRSSRVVMVSNNQTETINVNRVTAILKRDGYQLEREVVADATTAAASRLTSVDGRTLYFRGEGKEAMATISRDEHGNTVTVLNTISTLEQLK